MGRGALGTTANVFNVIGGMPPPEKLYLENTLGDAGDSVKAKVTGKATEPAGTGREENTKPEAAQVNEEVPPPSTEMSAPSPP